MNTLIVRSWECTSMNTSACISERWTNLQVFNTQSDCPSKTFIGCKCGLSPCLWSSVTMKQLQIAIISSRKNILSALYQQSLGAEK